MMTAAGNPFSLAGSGILVTGGGSGIGRGLAEALAGAGASVVLVGRSERVEAAAGELRAQGREAHAIRADMLDAAARVAAFEQAVSLLGRVDVLVPCHGMVQAGDVLEQEPHVFRDTLEANLTSVFELSRIAAQPMAGRGQGKLILIASMLSFFGGFRAAAYAASKGGVAQLTKAFATELAPRGVNVNAIAPGYVRTDLNRHVWSDPMRAEQVLGRIPAGRWGEPSDLGGAAVFLASRASDYLHGVVLPLDGGYLVR
jgi:2-dehydro-3-deoxy-D-gluconate 5-dehydrogenase